MGLEPIPKFQTPGFRNILHYAPSYNFTILLRVFDLGDLKNYEGLTTPENWDKLDDDSMVTLAATGGTYNFKNRFGTDDQISDAFIENLTIKYNLGMSGIGQRGTTAGTTATMVVREPNGMNLLTSLMAAFTKTNNVDQSKVLGSIHQVPVLLSVYFNLAPGASTKIDNSDTNLATALKAATRHIPVIITKVDFNITSSGTTYTITLVEVGTSGGMASAQQPLYETVTELEGKTIGDFLTDLIKKMNTAVQEMNTKSELEEYEYKINFFSDEFKNSRLEASVNALDPSTTTMIGESELQDLTESQNMSESLAAGSKIEPGAYKNKTWDAPDQIRLKIADREGTLKKGSTEPNYNQIYSGWTVPPPKPITTMTLNELKIWQKSVLDSGQLKVNSSEGLVATSPAAGAYQFIYTTLFGRPKSKKYPDGVPGIVLDTELNQLFSPTKQEELGKRLYDANKSSNKALSGKWAYFAYLDLEGGKDLRAQAAGTPRDFGQKLPGFDQVANAARLRQKAQDISNKIRKSSFNDRNRKVGIAAGQTVESVTKLLALNSEYMAKALKDSCKGLPPFIPYIKIYRAVDFEKIIDKNKIKKTITFNIIPIELLANTEGSGYDEKDVVDKFKKLSIREYQYLFTGKNIDILDLNLNFTNTINVAHAAYTRLQEPLASQRRVALNGATTTPITDVSKPNTGADTVGTNQASAAVLPPPSSAGLPKGFRDVEATYKTLLPYLFGRIKSDIASTGDLLKINLEIIGDPGLMPTTEIVLSSNHFERNYKNYLARQGSSEVLLNGYEPAFFRFIFNNPDPLSRAKEAYGGYYLYQTVSANFKDSGAFTMTIEATRENRTALVSKETVEENQRRLESEDCSTDPTATADFVAQENQRKAENERISNSLSLSNPGGSTLTQRIANQVGPSVGGLGSALNNLSGTR